MVTYIKKCPECESINLSVNKDKGEVTCRDCGLVIEERMIDFGQEWREFDDDQEKRRRTGAPMTYSVDAAEPLVICENDNISIVKIGDFVDTFLKKNPTNIQRDGEVEYLPLNGTIKTVSFDKEYNVAFHPIHEVSRHPVESVYEISLETGKKIKVTGSHSVFTVKDNKVTPIKVSDLREDDFLVAPKTLPSIERNNLRLNILHEFLALPNLEKNIYLRHLNDTIFVKLGEKAPEIRAVFKNWRRHRTLPLWVIQKHPTVLDGEDLSKCKIGTYSSTKELPIVIPINENLCRLLGWYASEGTARKYGLIFSFGTHETEFIDEVAVFMEKLFGISIKEYVKGTATQLEAKSKLLSILFTHIFKAGRIAKEKRVPSLLFALPTRLKVQFLHTYLHGDGSFCITENPGRMPEITLSSTSANPELTNDIIALCLFLGINANYQEELAKAHEIAATKQMLPESLSTKAVIRNPFAAQQLLFIETIPERGHTKGPIEELMPFPQEYLRELKYRRRLRVSKNIAINLAEKRNDTNLIKLAKAPFKYLRVRKIERCPSTNGYAYDISVPNCENFVGGRGAIFLHNTRFDRGLGTDIGQKGDIFQLKGKGMNKFFRLRKWQYRISTAIERNLKLALAELKRVASYLKLTKSVEEEAARIYTMAVQRGLVRGRSMESVVAGALYAACRRHEVPRTLDELSEASGIDKKEVGRTYRFITRELGIRILPSNPVDYIPRFTSALKLSAETQSRAVEILELAEKSELTSGRGPTGIAAASLYVAALLNNEKRTQREVADIAGVTEVTIRNRYKELFKKLKLKEVKEKPKKTKKSKK